MQALTLALLILASNEAIAHPLSQTQAPGPRPSMDASPRPNPADACLIDICGIPARANLHISRLDKREDELVHFPGAPPFSPRITKLVQQYTAAEDENSKKLIDTLRQSQADTKARLEGIPKMLYLVGGINPQASKAIKYKTIYENGERKRVVDEEASRKAMQGISEQEQTDAIALNQFMMEIPKQEPEVAYSAAYEKEPPEWAIHMLYPKDTVHDGVKKLVEKTRERLAILSKNSTPLETNLFFSEVSRHQLKSIEKHIQDGSVDENELRQLLTWNSRYTLSNQLFKSEKNPLAKKNGPITEEVIISFGGTQRAIAEVEKKIARTKDEALYALKDCQTDYFINQGILPTRAQNEILARDIDKAKNAVIKMIKEGFPTESQDKMIESIQNTKFILPKTKDEYEDELSNSFAEKIRASKTDSANLSALNNKERRNLLAALSNLRKDDSPQDLELEENNKYCGAFRYKLVDDANFTPLGSIKLSLSTATTDEETRLATLMHEMGHSLSKTITDHPDLKRKFSGVRKCLTEQHTEKRMLNFETYEDGQFTEEDFADTVAGVARGRHSAKNPWCSFLSGDLKTNRYLNNSMEHHEPDPHSADIFRLLNFQFMKSGSLPKNCVNFLKATNYLENFRNCFNLAKAQYSTEQKPRSTQ